MLRCFISFVAISKCWWIKIFNIKNIFLMIISRPISGCTEQNFTKFSQNGRYMHDCWWMIWPLLSDCSKNDTMATNFGAKLRKLVELTFIWYTGVPKQIGALQFLCHEEYMVVIQLRRIQIRWAFVQLFSNMSYLFKWLSI